jgi:phosphate transport system substrate-binding protein
VSQRLQNRYDFVSYEADVGHHPNYWRDPSRYLRVLQGALAANGDFKDEVKEQPGSASVVQGVTVDRYGIGYSGIGYATAGVRAVPLSEKDGGKCVEATADNAYSGSYPLARFLYVYVNKAPGKGLDPLTREFVRMIASKQGQEAVVKDGYFPIPAAVAKEELAKVQ